MKYRNIFAAPRKHIYHLRFSQSRKKWFFFIIIILNFLFFKTLSVCRFLQISSNSSNKIPGNLRQNGCSHWDLAETSNWKRLMIRVNFIVSKYSSKLFIWLLQNFCFIFCGRHWIIFKNPFSKSFLQNGRSICEDFKDWVCALAE